MDDSWLNKVNWTQDGLVPAVAQETAGGRVLTVAWMNREALSRTAQTGEAHYWSRSRRKLWRKGEESGHIQKVRAIRLDCDEDVGTIGARPRGQAAQRAVRLRELPHDLGQAGDGDAAVIFEQGPAGRRQLGAAEAADADAGIERPKLADERTRVQIARRLAARDQQSRAHGSISSVW